LKFYLHKARFNILNFTRWKNN